MDDTVSVFDSVHDENEESAPMITMEWSTEHESILIEWADKAMCYRWLHARSNAKFSYLTKMFTVPVIIISTLTGTANFAQDRVPKEYLNYFVMSIGGLNILAGIISTIQQFLKINELNEAHRISSIAWDKFYRNIKVELAKNRKERLPVNQMLKICKEEFDRLMETSPVIREDIIQRFTKTFKNSNEFVDITKPEICDELISTRKFLFEEKVKKESITKPFAQMLKKKREMDKQKRLVKNFIVQFKMNQEREPLIEEMVEHFADVMSEEKIKSIYKIVSKDVTERIQEVDTTVEKDRKNTVLLPQMSLPRGDNMV